MKLRYKLLLGFVTLLGAALVALAATVSYTADCEPGVAEPAGTELVQAIRYRCYGGPDVLELADIAKPVPGADEVLVKVIAASVNPLDWHYMRGSPYVMRLGSGIGAPKNDRLGADFAGVVEAVGSNVTRFEPGDAVFGIGRGSFGEYLTKHADGSIAKIPPGASYADGAAIPVAGVTALQALRDHGRLGKGQRVLINGASGGVGTYAVQIAKAYGADVTGVCSERNRELVQSLGADRVIDYRQANYTEEDEQYDLIVDMIGNHPVSANLDVLAPDGRLVIVGGEKGDWIGPMSNMIKAPLMSPFIDQELIVMLAHPSGDDLAELAGMMENGQLVSVIDTTYPLSEVPAAIAHSESGRARGKIIIDTGL